MTGTAYQHTEHGPWWLWALSALAILGGIGMHLLDWPLSAFYVSASLVGAGIAAHYTRMVVRVTPETVAWRFRFSPEWQTVAMTQVEFADAVPRPRGTLVGTHVTRYGICEGVGGVGVVRILSFGREPVLLGTNAPEALIGAITRMKVAADAMVVSDSPSPTAS